MENLHFWQGVLLLLGTIFTYRGGQALLQNDEEFIRSVEKRARQNAKFDKISEKEAMQKYADYIKEDASGWRRMSAIPLAVGIMMLFAFVVTLFL
jgi:hypothetical protein